MPKRIAEKISQINAIGLDLPRVEPHFQDFAGESPAADRIEFQTGDFFGDEPLPEADVYVLGHILHDRALYLSHIDSNCPEIGRRATDRFRA